VDEFELIQKLTADLPKQEHLLVGPGDDCAVLDLGIPGKQLLFKTDAVVEGIHFDATADPEQIGHKAIARPLSDVAAMGGTPISCVVTLGLPPGFDPDKIEKIYGGLKNTAARFQVSVAGGEITTNPGQIFINVALIGTIDCGRVLTRQGAEAGDGIFVTGELGGSISGHHLSFKPRLDEGRWLAANFPIRSMIDLSDGLSGDLPRLLREGLGAEILARAVPISREAKLRSRQTLTEKTPLLAALTDGEDFELLFLLPRGHSVALLDGWKKQFPDVRLSCIGTVVAREGIRIKDQDRSWTLKPNGYVHFKKPQ
jgi:thiamine-monophosphate kinase